MAALDVTKLLVTSFRTWHSCRAPVAALLATLFVLGCESKSTAPEPLDEFAKKDESEPVRDLAPKGDTARPNATQTPEVIAETEIPSTAMAVPSAAPNPTEPAPKTATKTDSPEAKSEADAPAPIRRGGAAQGEGFRVWLEGPTTHSVGKASSVQVVLTAKEPFKCNEKYPYKFKPSAAGGVTFPDSTLRGMQVGKQRATMTIPFTPKSPGAQNISGELSFSVCTDDKCLIEKQALTFPIQVNGS